MKLVPNHSPAFRSSSMRRMPQAAFTMMESSQSLAVGLNLPETITVLKSKHAKCKTKSLNKNTFVFSSGCLRQLKPAHKQGRGVMGNERREGGLREFSI